MYNSGKGDSCLGCLWGFFCWLVWFGRVFWFEFVCLPVWLVGFLRKMAVVVQSDLCNILAVAYTGRAGGIYSWFMWNLIYVEVQEILFASSLKRFPF